MDQKQWVYFGVYSYSIDVLTKQVGIIRFRLISDISLYELEEAEILEGREMGSVEDDINFDELVFFTEPELRILYPRKILLRQKWGDPSFEEGATFLATVKTNTHWKDDLKKLLRGG